MEEQQHKKPKQLCDIENKISKQGTLLPITNFNEMVNSLTSIGSFYFFVVDFHDMSISHVSASIQDFYDLDPETVTFNEIVKTIHPDDLNFVTKAEKTTIKYIRDVIGKDNIKNYKSNYSFRSKLKNGEYCLLNHQAIVLTTDNNGGFGKSLNIHTNINHITNKNSYTSSLIGLNGNPSFMNLKVSFSKDYLTIFSKREVEIIKLISKGYINSKIANKLNISEHTVKTHRKNINKKAECKNVSELLNKYILKNVL